MGHALSNHDHPALPRRSSAPPASFAEGIRALRRYVTASGHSRVKIGYQCPTGFHLYNWVRTQRQLLAKGKLSSKRARQLADLGVRGRYLDEMYQTHFDLIAKAQMLTGTKDLRADFVMDGVKLGDWLAHAKFRARRGQLADKWVTELEALGIAIKRRAAKRRLPLKRDVTFERGTELLHQFRSKFGHVRVPQKDGTYRGFNLGSWLHLQRRKWREGRLPQTSIDVLSKLGVKPRH